MRRIVVLSLLIFTTIFIGCSQVRPEERPEPVNRTTEDPITDFQASPQSGVAPLLVTFEWAASGGEVCTIDFGDGTSETVACTAGSLTHDYQDPGTFTAVFTAQANGRTYNRDRQIAATTAPPGSLQSTFRADPTVAPIGTAVAFTWTVSGPSETCVLDFNDGSAPLSFSPCENGSHSHTYSAVGNYAATFVVTATDGTTDSKVATVNITTTANEVSPIESFSANPTQGVAPLAVDIAWHAPDAVACVLHIGSDSYGVSCSDTRQETFSVVGTHTITFAATSATGTTFEQNATVRVGATPNSVPEVTHFSATPQKVSEGDPVTFSWTATDDDGDPLTCSIAFGDGSTWQGDCATGSTDHTYTSAGKYQPEITASDPTGASAGLRTSVEVTTPGGTTPTIVPPAIQKFTVTPITGEKPLAVSVSWEYSNQGGEPVTCTIHSGIAGASPDTFNPCPETGTHTLTYPDEGTYTLKFSARKDGANATERTQSITVTDTFVQPKPALSGVSVSPTSGRAPLPVTANFSVDPNGDPTTCTINWADGSPLTTINNCDGSISETHTFTGKGDYHITITAENSGGTTTFTQQIRVDPQLPEITSLNASPATGTAPIDVEFSWTIDTFGETYQCTLDPGDGTGPISVSDCTSPVTHRYTKGTDPLNAYTATLAIIGPSPSVTRTTSVAVSKPAPTALVSAFTRVASVDTNESVILNHILGGMLGTTATIELIDYDAILSTDIALLQFLDALKTVDPQLMALTPSDILSADIAMANILTALDTVIGGNLLGSLPNLSSLADTIKIADLLVLPQWMLGTDFSDLAVGITIPAFDFLLGSIQLFNHKNVATANIQPVSLTSNLLGITEVGNVGLKLSVVEPPTIVVGEVSTTFNSAGIRAALEIGLVDVTDDTPGLFANLLDALNLTIPLVATIDLSSSEVKLVHLDLALVIAKGEGSIESIDRLIRAVTLDAQVGIAELYLGTPTPPTNFFDPTVSTAAITSAHLGYSPIGEITLSGEACLIGGLICDSLEVTVKLKARALARGSPAPTTKFQISTIPGTQTIMSSPSQLGALVDTLVSSLELDTSVSITGGSSITGVLASLLNEITNIVTNTVGSITTALKSVLGGTTGVLQTVLDPLLRAITNLTGVSIGSMDIHVWDVY